MIEKTLEQTLVLIKTDALKNSLTGYVLSLLSEFHTGLRFSGAKIVHVSKMLAEEHYTEHKEKSFFPELLSYLTGELHYPEQVWKRRTIALVYQGPDAVKKIRTLAGPTNPFVAREKNPGCIRSLGTMMPIKNAQGEVVTEIMENLIHASATNAEAEREIKLWFKPVDIPPNMNPYATEESDEHYYFKNGKLYKEHVKGSICLLAPGNIGWKSDIDALSLIIKGEKAEVPQASIIAKYLMNLKIEE